MEGLAHPLVVSAGGRALTFAVFRTSYYPGRRVVETPTFSVIIPTHNRAGLVLRAIDSVFEAVGSHSFQLIVVDDASTDITCTMIEERFRGDTRLTLFRLMSNSGPARARNVGFDHAVGDFVVFLDSDDVLTRGALETAARAFEAIPSLQFLTLEGESRALDRCDANHRIVRSQCPGWNGEGFDAERLAATTLPATTEDGDRTRLSAGDFLSAILFGDLFYLSGLVMRRAAARIAGPFNERFFYLEDWEFAARLCLTGAGGYVDEVGFHRECGRVDQLSLRGNAWRRAAMHLHVLNAIEAACERIGCALPVALRRARGSALYAFARCLNERGRVGRARDYFVRALLLDYKPHKCAVWLLHGFAPQRLRVWFLRRFEWASGR